MKAEERISNTACENVSGVGVALEGTAGKTCTGLRGSIVRDIESRIGEVVTSAGRLCPFLPITLRRDPRHMVTRMGRGLRPKPGSGNEKPKDTFPGEKTGIWKGLGKGGATLWGFRGQNQAQKSRGSIGQALGSYRPESKPS